MDFNSHIFLAVDPAITEKVLPQLQNCFDASENGLKTKMHLYKNGPRSKNKLERTRKSNQSEI